MDTLKRPPFCVALTGGIASGKTTVSDLFSNLGVPIIDADVIAHQLTQKKTEAYQHIIDHFGADILCDDKTLNRKKLREVIFQNPDEKQWLEDLLHPLIRKQMKQAINQIDYPYCICVIPLLAESKKIDFVDRVLVVTASKKVQVARAAARDRSHAAQIEQIIQAQAKTKSRLAIADDVLENKDNIETLQKQVIQLHGQYLKLAESHQ